MLSMQHLCFCAVIVPSLFNGYQSIYQALIQSSDEGFQFLPVNDAAQLLSTFISGSNLFGSCSLSCNQNILCRTFDINGEVPNQCRLFQGDIHTHGSIVPSSVSNARVGGIQYSSDLFLNYGQSCSSNSAENRYLICGDSATWECPPNAYWNPASGTCLAQSPLLGSLCQQGLDMCRKDLNYTCLQFNQCGRT